jgi:hypothetical protein
MEPVNEAEDGTDCHQHESADDDKRSARFHCLSSILVAA